MDIYGHCFYVDKLWRIPYLNHIPRRARIDAPGAFHHIVIRGIERKAIFKDDTDREDFIERFSKGFGLIVTGVFSGGGQFVEATLKNAGEVYDRRMRRQLACIVLSAVIAAACRFLDIEENKVTRRFNVDRSAISRATLRVSRDPELPAATKMIQRELELERNRH